MATKPNGKLKRIVETTQFQREKTDFLAEDGGLALALTAAVFLLERAPERGQRAPWTDIWALPTTLGVTIYYKFEGETVTLLSLQRCHLL